MALDASMMHTVTADIQIDYATNSDVDHAEKALILLLEFLLIEYLHRQDAFLIGTSTGG